MIAFISHAPAQYQIDITCPVHIHVQKADTLSLPAGITTEQLDGYTVIHLDKAPTDLEDIQEISVPDLSRLVVNTSGNVTIDLPTLSKLSLSTFVSGSVELHGAVDQVTISSDQSSTVIWSELYATSIDVSTAGSSSVNLVGNSKNLTVRSHDSSTFKSPRFKSDTLYVEYGTSGDGDMGRITTILSGHLDSVGSFVFHGPGIDSTVKSGIGSVTHSN